VRLVTAARLLYGSLHERGVRGTLERVQRLAAMRNEARRKTRAGKRFDDELGVETSKWVRVPDLDTESPNREHATSYEPSSVDEFRLLMKMLRVDHRSFTFIDYGSGKGRVLMLAAEYPFKRIVGVEFAESLNRVARKNVAALGADAARIEVVLADAAVFDPPPDPLVLYFFNPFGPPVLETVLTRICDSLERTPRPAYVVITGPPELSRVVERSGFERVDVEELGWRTRGVFVAGDASGSVARP